MTDTPMDPSLVPADALRAAFSQAMSDMYKTEVPLYGQLCDLVAEINASAAISEAAIADTSAPRMDVERHGAVRVGTPEELANIRRLFAVMGMVPIGYYDLSIAGLPLHTTAFRPNTPEALARQPFRVFTSLLRPGLIADETLREQVRAILVKRRIITARCLALVAQAETEGGLAQADADELVCEALKTFRWHSQATVDWASYQSLRAAHPLIADIVCFKEPHINHLTPCR